MVTLSRTNLCRCALIHTVEPTGQGGLVGNTHGTYAFLLKGNWRAAAYLDEADILCALVLSAKGQQQTRRLLR